MKTKRTTTLIIVLLLILSGYVINHFVRRAFVANALDDFSTPTEAYTLNALWWTADLWLHEYEKIIKEEVDLKCGETIVTDKEFYRFRTLENRRMRIRELMERLTLQTNNSRLAAHVRSIEDLLTCNPTQEYSDRAVIPPEPPSVN